MNALILEIKMWLISLFTKRQVTLNKDEFTKFENAIKKQPPNSLDELKIVLANYPSAKWYYRLPTVMRAGGDEQPTSFETLSYRKCYRKGGWIICIVIGSDKK